MFNFTVTPEVLTYVLAALVAVAFDWAPGLSTWYGKLSESRKKTAMIAFLLVITAGIYGGICAGIFLTQYACNQVGMSGLFQVFLLSVGINQGVHKLFKPTTPNIWVTTEIG